MVLAVISTLTSTALAENEGVTPYTDSVYYPIRGNTWQSGSKVMSSMTVHSNPDNAKLRITHTLECKLSNYPDVVGISEAGVMSFSFYQILQNAVEYEPVGVYVCYEAFKGAQYPDCVVYGYCDIDLDSITP